MKTQEIVEIIRKRFGETGSPARIPKLTRGLFEAELAAEGIYVDNLGGQPLLPWDVFVEAIAMLEKKGGRAKRGDAMSAKLGSRGLPLDSVEGHIAHVTYRKRIGISVTRRITPIACILIWAGLCRHEPSYLVLSRPRSLLSRSA